MRRQKDEESIARQEQLRRQTIEYEQQCQLQSNLTIANNDSYRPADEGCT